MSEFTYASAERSLQRLRAAVRDQPSVVADLTRRAEEAASTAVTAESPDGRISVVLRAGLVSSIDISQQALLEPDNHTLADQVRQSVNLALDRAQARLAEVADVARAGDGTGAENAGDPESAMDRLERSMDELDARLDVLEQALEQGR